jgi:Neprosin
MATDRNIQRLDHFIDSVASAKFADFAQRPTCKLRDPDLFAAMKEHVLDHYRGVEGQGSFVSDGGQVVDCIPVNQQPSARRLTSPIPKVTEPPELSDDLPPSFADTRSVGPQLTPNGKDVYGNAMWCPEGCIPMARVTLDTLVGFETLDAFLRRPETAAGSRVIVGVYKAKADGVSSLVNIWDPLVRTDLGQRESDSFVALYGESAGPIQAIQAGWQVAPSRYQTMLPCLFTYWTSDGGQNGCYNLLCNGFVQTNKNWILGGPIGIPSQPGGPLTAIEVTWVSFPLQGWYLYLGGTRVSDRVGYYPVSLFGSGPLSKEGTALAWGGRVSSTSNNWPFMGSGAFAETGYGHAAFHAKMRYTGSSVSGWVPVNPGLSKNTKCYTIESSPKAKATLYFGGPGGTDC